MARVSKPCERGGCTAAVVRSCQGYLNRAHFCSHRCTYLERVRRGSWVNGIISMEARRRGARKSGQLSGERRRRQAMVAAVHQAMKLMPADVVEVLTREQLQRLQVAVGRVWIKARQGAYQVGYHARGKRRPPQVNAA